jgi:hypothetical protein
MTQRYAHLRDEALKKAAGVMDNVFQQNNVVSIEEAKQDGQE